MTNFGFIGNSGQIGYSGNANYLPDNELNHGFLQSRVAESDERRGVASLDMGIHNDLRNNNVQNPMQSDLGKNNWTSPNALQYNNGQSLTQNDVGNNDLQTSNQSNLGSNVWPTPNQNELGNNNNLSSKQKRYKFCKL